MDLCGVRFDKLPPNELDAELCGHKNNVKQINRSVLRRSLVQRVGY